MVTAWCVKITFLPDDVTTEELATRFNVDEDDINLPHGQAGPNYFARVNGFESEHQANLFVSRWHNQRVRSAKIKCKANPTNSQLLPRTALPLSGSNSSTRTHEPSADGHEMDRDNATAGLAPCQNGSRCFHAKCTRGHPPGWDACDDGADCREFHCRANHPFGRTRPCRRAQSCRAGGHCESLHPTPGIEVCPEGTECRVWQCHGWHSTKRPKDCRDGEQCFKIACKSVHPPHWQACRNADDCADTACQLNHSPNRPSPCKRGAACGDYYCPALHPIGWDPCERGSKCANRACPRSSHPPDRVLLGEQEASSQSTIRVLKTQEQRDAERLRAQLPMLKSKDAFCRRLENERVLVVTAETGSGKSTQLPQYAAEYFDGMVVCTQPRVIAAISLAHRVASEYDGTPVGRSVGYRVGITGFGRGHNRVPGTDIIFMTDGALVQAAAEEDQLRDVRVLIIDEAHERSLHTDIAMGIAKLLLRSRPTDFYVVISSATIQPEKFLAFFDRSNVEPLRVPGRVFEVDVENDPPSAGPVEAHAVTTLLRLYDKHEGTTLVFLAGQREIEQAMGLFERKIPKDCVALPLYGALSPEEQQQVLQFDGGPNGEQRMVVFCTNIAETSLTVNNTRLVIDSGLIKEARFDPVLRLTTIDTMQISRASADQRKGRAGRTAKGHCIRLYEEESLIRENANPAILCSSLDLVVLQLVQLRMDPLEFPFIDAPSRAAIQDSLDTLEDLACIDADHDITLRGELFVKLNFDPRYSAFLVDSYVHHGPILQLATTIVAILTAPGSLFLTTGTTPEDRKATQNRIAAGARRFESDLLYHVSIYNGWRDMRGAIDPTTRICAMCRALCREGDICRPCRAAYSTTRELNNKILNVIERVCSVTIEALENPRWQLEPDFTSESNESEVIGANLYKYFPEHYGYFLKPNRRDTDVLMSVNGIRARVETTSALMQARDDNDHFMAMQIRRVGGNRYLVEHLHPIPSRQGNLKIPMEQLRIRDDADLESRDDEQN